MTLNYLYIHIIFTNVYEFSVKRAVELDVFPSINILCSTIFIATGFLEAIKSPTVSLNVVRMWISVLEYSISPTSSL